MGGLKIGEIYAVLSIVTTAFTQGLSGAQASLLQFGNSMATVGRSLTLVTAPLDAFGAGVIKAGMDFDTAMAKIQGLVGLSTDDINKLRQAALSLAGETGRAPVELANALYYLTSSGLDANQSIDVLGVSAKAAATGLGKTEDVARAVAFALNAYGDSGLTAANITDMLIAGVKDGTIEADQFADVLGRVIGVASSVGVGFDQVVSVIATLSRVGLDAHESMTSLSAIFSNLLKPGAASKEILDAIGMSMQQLLNVARGPNGIVEVYRILNERLSDDQFAKVVPNVRALRGALNLLSQDSASVDKVWQDVAGSAGDLNTAFGVASNTAKFQLDKTMADLQKTMLDFWEVLRGPVIDILKSIQEGLANLSEWFKNLDPGVQRLIVGIAAFLIAAGPLLIFLGMLTIALSALLPVIGAVIGILAGPVGVILAIVAAGALLLDKLGLLDDVLRSLGQVWDTFVKAISQFIDIIGGWIHVIGQVADALHGLWVALNPGADAADQARKVFDAWTADMNMSYKEQEFIWKQINMAWQDGRIHTEQEAKDMILHLDQIFKSGAIQVSDDGDYIPQTVGKAMAKLNSDSQISMEDFVKIVQDAITHAKDQFGQLHDIFMNVGQDFTMSTDAAQKFASLTGLSVEQVNEAWREFTVEQSKALTAVTEFAKTAGPDFKMTTEAAQLLAQQSGVSADLIMQAWDKVKNGLSGLNDQASHALGEISVDSEKAWQTFQNAADYTIPDVEARMAELQDRITQLNGMDFSVLGPDAFLDAQAAIKKFQAEWDLLNEFVKSGGKDMTLVAKAVAEAFVADANKIEGALKDLSTTGTHHWKKFIKSLQPKKQEDPAESITGLQKKIKQLESVHLASLGPAALRSWMAMYVSTKSQLEEIQFFVDHKGEIIATTIPEAVENSVDDNVSAWKKVFGITTDETERIMDTVDTTAGKTASAFPDHFKNKQKELDVALGDVKHDTTTTYDQTQTSVTQSAVDAAKALPSQLVANLKPLGTVLNTTARIMRIAFTTLADAATTWGANLARNWVSAIIRVLQASRSFIAHAARYALGGIEAHSPPAYGPLRNLPAWGENAAESFIRPFAETLRRSTDVIDALSMSPVMALAVSPAAARDPGTMGRGEEIHYHEHYHVGTLIADDNGVAELTRRQERVSKIRNRGRYHGTP